MSLVTPSNSNGWNIPLNDGVANQSAHPSARNPQIDDIFLRRIKMSTVPYLVFMLVMMNLRILKKDIQS
jgi:hypothetical protein